MKSFLSSAAVAATTFTTLTNAQGYSVDSTDAIKQTAKSISKGVLAYYHGDDYGGIPGVLPGPPPHGDYYWWESGAMWGTIMDYWLLTGDDQYNDLVIRSMMYQRGPNDDYQPPNVTLSLGNDDQGFWGMAAMTGAENRFPDPPDSDPGWLALAQGVFATQASPDRHDGTCGGGIRWQIPFGNNGFDYKNSIANGCFFNLGARLARYTGNSSYADWADKTWDWMMTTGLIDNKSYAIYDGAHVETNCTDINTQQFSYNNAVFLLGAAYMYNYTDGAQKWKDRVDKLVDHGLAKFFPDGIAFEAACEKSDSCTTDMQSFKGYVHRWYATTTKVAPFTAEKILPVLKTSAEAAVKTCTGGEDGKQCGFIWTSPTFDGKLGVGEMMNVLAASSSLLIGDARAPVTADKGGTSKGNPHAGEDGESGLDKFTPITTGDKAGAGIVTLLLICGGIATFILMATDYFG